MIQFYRHEEPIWEAANRETHEAMGPGLWRLWRDGFVVEEVWDYNGRGEEGNLGSLTKYSAPATPCWTGSYGADSPFEDRYQFSWFPSGKVQRVEIDDAATGVWAAKAEWDESGALISIESGGARPSGCRPMNALDTKQFAITAMEFFGDTILTGGLDGTVKQWRLNSEGDSMDLWRCGGMITTMAKIPQSTKILVGDSQGGVNLIDPRAGVMATCSCHSGTITDTACSSELAATVSCDGTARVHRVDSAECQHVLKGGHVGHLSAVSFSLCGKFLFTGGLDSKICIWNVESGNLIGCQDHHKHWVTSIIAVDGNRIYSSSKDGTVIAWNYENGEYETVIDIGVQLEFLAKCGKYLVAVPGHGEGGPREILIDPQTNGIAAKILIGAGNLCPPVSILGGNAIISPECGGHAQVCMLEKGETEFKRNLSDHGCPVGAVAGDDRGENVATGDATGILRIWDLWESHWKTA